MEKKGKAEIILSKGKMPSSHSQPPSPFSLCALKPTTPSTKLGNSGTECLCKNSKAVAKPTFYFLTFIFLFLPWNFPLLHNHDTTGHII